MKNEKQRGENNRKEKSNKFVTFNWMALNVLDLYTCSYPQTQRVTWRVHPRNGKICYKIKGTIIQSL